MNKIFCHDRNIIHTLYFCSCLYLRIENIQVSISRDCTSVLSISKASTAPNIADQTVRIELQIVNKYLICRVKDRKVQDRKLNKVIPLNSKPMR